MRQYTRIYRATKQRLFTWALLGVLVWIVGCSGDKRVSVSGTISLDSKPLPDVFVVFEPLGAGAAKIATGKTNSNGQYSLAMLDGHEGCLVGKHAVRLTTVSPDAMEDERSSLPEDKIPLSYQESPPVFEVVEQTDKADFNLSKK